MGIEKTIEIKAIDKEKALKRALNILGVELTENEAVEIVEKVKPRKSFLDYLEQNLEHMKFYKNERKERRSKGEKKFYSKN